MMAEPQATPAPSRSPGINCASLASSSAEKPKKPPGCHARKPYCFGVDRQAMQCGCVRQDGPNKPNIDCKRRRTCAGFHTFPTVLDETLTCEICNGFGTKLGLKPAENTFL